MATVLSSPIFGRGLKIIAAVLVFIYLLLAAYFFIGRYYLQQLDLYTKNIEEALFKQTGLQWQIEGLHGNWHGINPVINVGKIKASRDASHLDLNSAAYKKHDANNIKPLSGDVLNAGAVHVYVDVFASLVNRELRLYGARANRLDVVLQKNSHNKITLAGIEYSKSDSQFNVAGFVDHLRYFSLESLDVYIEQQSGQQWQINKIPSISMKIKRSQTRREFSFMQQAGVDNDSSKALAVVIVSDDGFFNDKSRIVGQLVDNDSGLEKWLNIFSGNWQLKQSTANIWFEKQSHQYEWLLTGLSGVAHKPLLNKEKKLNGKQNNSLSSSYHFNVNLRLTGNSKAAQLDWQNISLLLNEKPLYIPVGGAAFTLENTQLKKASVLVEELNLASLANTINELALLKAPEQQIINTLNPKGSLKHLSIDIPIDKPEEFLLSAKLHEVAVDPWKGSPGANKVNGKLFASAKDGRVELDSREGFSLFFASIYHVPMLFSEARGTVNWRVTASRFFVLSDNVALKSISDDAAYGGQFAVNGRITAEGEPSHLLLNIGVTSAQVPDLLAYIPYVAPQSLINWTQQTQASGYVEHGAFIYNGPLRKSEADKRSINAYFQLADSELYFYKDWPKLRNANALLTINDNVADIELYSANLQGFSLERSEATVNANTDAGYVDIDGLASGDVNSILSFLRDAPLSEGLAKQLKGWQGVGAFDYATVKLHIPFAQEKLNTLAVDIKLLLDDAQLTMHNPDLVLNALNGEIGFDSANGLYAPQLDALLWGHAVQIKIGDYSNTEQPKGMTSLRLQATSKMAVASINQWLKQPALAFTSGVAAFDFLLEHTESSSRLSVHSDLVGVKLDFPKPLNKEKNRIAELNLRWDLQLPTQPMSITIDHYLVALFNFDHFQLSGGLLSLGDGQEKNKNLVTQNNPAANALLISGSFPLLNLENWQQFVTDYIQFDKKLNPVSNDNKALSNEVELIIDDFRIHQITAFGQQLDNAVVGIHYDTSRWVFDVESDQLGGTVKLSENIADGFNQVIEESNTLDSSLHGLPQIADNVPLRERFIINLDYLRLPSKNVDSSLESISATSAISAWDIPNLQFDVSQLYLGDRPLGRWHFLFNSGDNTVLIHDLKVAYASLNLLSDKNSGLLWAADKQGNIVSSLDIDMSSHDFTQFIDTAMNDKNALPLLSKDFKASLSLSWDGSPEDISFEKLNGELGFEFGSGRFLKTSESATGVLKLLGLLNFDALVRRVRLDFSDVYENGLSFDKISGKLNFANNQIAFLDTPIDVFSPGSKFSLVGGLDLNSQTIDADLIMTLPVASNLPWIAALAGGLPVAAGAFIVTKVLDKQLNKLSSAVYRVDGSLNDPQVSFERIFDDSSNKSSP